MTKAKFVERNLQKLGFLEAIAQIENTPEIIAVEGVEVLEVVAKEGGGDGEEVPEAVSVEGEEKEVKDLRPTLPPPPWATNASPVMGSLLPAPADPLLGSGQSLGNLSPASLPSPGYIPRFGLRDNILTLKYSTF